MSGADDKTPAGDVGASGETQPARTVSEAQPKQSASKEELQPTVVDATKKGKRASPLSAGMRLGDFELIRQLGRGGMGEVHLATQVSLDRPVAIKFLASELAGNEHLVERFGREARSMARLQHANIVQVYAAVTEGDRKFVAIEYIDGQAMDDWMKQLGKLAVGDALHVVLVCADALRHAHEKKIIHRDIKPANILVAKNGLVKVADFGLAKALDDDLSLTASGAGMGTPQYMAPEQARNAKHVDQRADIYALGIMLYYFITGDLPFVGDSIVEITTAKEMGKFQPARRLNAEVPERIDLIIDRMVAANPNHRYKDYDELIRDLQKLGLANQSLGFIAEHGGQPTAKLGAHFRTSADSGDASKPTATAVSLDPQKKRQRKEEARVWQVQHTNAKGEDVVSKMTTVQIIQGIKGGMLDIKSKTRKSKKGRFLPLAQYAEFTEVVNARIITMQNEKRREQMQDIYQQIDRQEKWRGITRWFKRMTENTINLVILIILLVAIGVGLFYLANNATEVIHWIARLFGVEDWGE